MDVRRRQLDGAQAILMKMDPLEYAIIRAAVEQQYKNLREAFRKDINLFKDPQYTAGFLAVMRVMIKEMDDAKPNPSPRPRSADLADRGSS